MNDDKPPGKVHILMMGLLLMLFVCLTLFYGRPVIQNDGISYYALAISLLEDHDFNLENQYQQHQEIRVLRKRETGKIASYYSCGFALLYAPFLYGMDLFPALRELRPYAQNVKFPFSHNLGIFTGSILYGFGSVILAYYLLIRHKKLSPAGSLLLAAACFIGTPLIFYTFTVPSFAHASDTFLITCAFGLTISKNPFLVRFIRFRNVLLGFVLALSVLLRNNNIVIVPTMVLGLIYLERANGWKNALRTCVEVFAGALPILIIHVFFNFSQYGKLFATGYTVVVTKHAQKRFFKFFWIFTHPAVGIYPWSPIALLGTVGLILGAAKKRSEAIVALAVVLVVIISIRMAAIIFPGSTFGQRLLTHLYIFWVFGLSELFVRYKKAVTVLAAACVIWTFVLFNTYFILTGSRVSKIMTRAGGSSPLEWIQTSADAYRQARHAGQTTNPLSFWYANTGAKPYPAVIHILFKE